jgi:glycosyltransferase involved in cell wall biosynthesis
MAAKRLPSFDLVVGTVDRVADLERLFASLDAQTHRSFRVLLVDQNPDDRLAPALERGRSFELVRLRSERGLSRARNAGLDRIQGDLVAFPDDDCSYEPGLLEAVGRRFADDPELDGLVGRAVNADGASSPSWSATPALLTRDNLWNRAISYTIFLRARIVERVGHFDETLGLGSNGRRRSGEEIEYLVRALDGGARIAYDPQLRVTHPERTYSPDERRELAARDGASVGYILRKHRYPGKTLGRMLARPVGGATLALARGNTGQARIHLATLRGRVHGYRS